MTRVRNVSAVLAVVAVLAVACGHSSPSGAAGLFERPRISLVKA